MPRDARAGALFALACYGAWGIFPAFWKLLAELPPPDVLAYRVVWTLVAVSVLLGFERRWGGINAVLGSRRSLLVLGASTTCISVNWLLFIDAVGSGRVLEASMGYFLNPLVNVALGVVVLNERLRALQQVAVAMATLSLAYLWVQEGHAPWIALALAGTFGIYGLLRKQLPIAPLDGLAIETAMMAPFALGWLGWRLNHGAPLMGGTMTLGLTLAASGPVTALPLLWFAAAAGRLRYSTLGFFQYVAPTGHFLLAVLAYGEQPSPTRMLAFAGIWGAILVYSADGWATARAHPAGAITRNRS